MWVKTTYKLCERVAYIMLKDDILKKIQGRVSQREYKNKYLWEICGWKLPINYVKE